MNHTIDSNLLWKFPVYKNKNLISKIMSSTVKNLVEMNTALVISACFIGFCCFLAVIARIIVSRTTQSSLVKELLYEAIAAAELCACCFELIIGEWRPTKHDTNNNQNTISSFKLILWVFLLCAWHCFLCIKPIISYRHWHSCWQFWSGGLCNIFVLFDNIVVIGMEKWRDSLSLHTHRGYARGKNDTTYGIVKNMGTIDGRLLRLPFCSSILVAGISSNVWRSCVRKLYNRSASKINHKTLCGKLR